MPSLITHCHCAQEAQKTVSGPHGDWIKASIAAHPRVFLLGAQGGDPFYYSLHVSGKRRKEYSQLGKRIHETRVNCYFAQLLMSLKGQTTNGVPLMGDTADFRIKLAYFWGLLSHYCLDTNTHPYVFYWSGFSDKEDSTRNQQLYKAFHSAFEKALDIHFHPNAHQTSLHWWIRVTDEEMEIIAKWLAEAMNKVYEVGIEAKEVNKSVLDLQRTYCLLKDFSGWKRKLVRRAERAFRLPGTLTANIYPMQIPPEMDVLNTSRREWCLPWNHEAVSDLGFMDLYRKAVDETLLFWEEAAGFLLQEKSVDSVLNLLGNRSYSTGLDCRRKMVFKHHQASAMFPENMV